MHPFFGTFLFAGLFGSIFGGVSADKAAKKQAKIYRMNARIIAQRAGQARKAARERARERRTEGVRLKARQTVLFAKSGLGGPGAGTKALVRDETTRRIERQAEIITEHGQFAYEQGISQAQIERKQASAVRSAGKAKMFTSLAGGLGQTAINWYRYGYEQ